MNFETAFHRLLGSEGGYSNHPSDPGGETMWGVTKAVAKENGYDGPMKALPVDVAQAIYKRQYWDAVRADELPESVRYAVFDGAVNSGVNQSIKWLQRAAGTDDDGLLGHKTLAAASACDPEALAARYLGHRLDMMNDLKAWTAFGRGWSQRLAEILMNIKG